MGGLYYKPTEFTIAIIQNIQLELLMKSKWSSWLLTINVIFVILVFITTKTFIMLQLGLLAQMVERGADNAKAVSSILTQTIIKFFFADLLTVSLFCFWIKYEGFYIFTCT